jgi:hypothetical protein
MEAPRQFVEELERNFGKQLRIRWSNQRGAWLIEQRVGRRREPGVRISEDNDAQVRARDGYWLLMEIRPGDRMPCPKCGLTLRVPIMDTADVVCDYCRLRGRQGRHRAAYFPLNDILIQHLRRLDPHGTHLDEVIATMDAENERLVASMEAHATNEALADASERYNRIVGIPQFSFSGAKALR